MPPAGLELTTLTTAMVWEPDANQTRGDRPEQVNVNSGLKCRI